MHQCEVSHEECKLKVSYLPLRLPGRLIKIQPRAGIEPFVNLVSAATLPSTTRYVTLSHCWGRTRMKVLRSDNEALYRKEIPWVALTKTFRDAINYTARLGIEYIWVDSFCINQDKLVDWLDEALSMASIFSNAFLNLAATSSPDGEGGLFLATNEYLANACVVEAQWIGSASAQYVVTDDLAWHRHINEAVLNRRAWVLQERLLSPRVVHFAADQISWECSELRGSESWPAGIPYDDFQIKTGAADVFDSMREAQGDRDELNACWLALVSRYSECALTKDSDKLIAIAGLAQCVQAFMQCQPTDYVAGFWRPCLPRDLLWRVASVGERYATYQAPSWSWASVKGAVVWNPSGALSVDANELVCELRHVKVELLSDSRHFGPISSAYIELTAPLYRVELGPAQTAPDPCFEFVTLNSRRFVDNDTLAETLDHEHIYEQVARWSSEHTVYFCRFGTVKSMHDTTLWISDGLLLERDSQTDRGACRRLGLMRLFHREDEDDFDAFCTGSMETQDNEYFQGQNDGKYTFKLI